ncbi:MAG: type I-B CRISPR-associated protein Cas7/Cst2/DevR [Candidatus Obscuribacterales bacterium]|nr:type I-B CRISPR-associated protein Cas7/Cst2/DevR [Candidatus Obscuribacterales bacterium]
MTKNIFGTVLTYVAPSSNYRGESEANRTVIQKITRAGKEYAVISPESMRNALREVIALKGLECNRSRLHNEDQLAVEFKDFPNADKYADDFFFGYMVADGKTMKPTGRPAKRDSILRMNLAVALSPYRFDATFHQSPQNAGGSPWKNQDNSGLLHKEISYTAFQYPFALSIADCMKNSNGPKWTAVLLESIGELSNVAGGHARSFFEMAPRSLVIRISQSLVAGFNTYGFNEAGEFPELSRLNENDLPASEFWIAGELVRNMEKSEKQRLTDAGAHLFENTQICLKAIAEQVSAAGAKK